MMVSTLRAPRLGAPTVAALAFAINVGLLAPGSPGIALADEPPNASHEPAGLGSLSRHCTYATPEDREGLRITCNDGSVYSYENLEQVTLRSPFDPYCSYLLQSGPGRETRETKEEAKRRLMAEDLFRVAYGHAPRCYEPRREDPAYLALADRLKKMPIPDDFLEPKTGQVCALPGPIQFKVAPAERSRPNRRRRRYASPEGEQLGRALREEFERTRECPRAFNDIEKLREITRQAKRAGFRNDVRALIVRPDRLRSGARAQELPTGCGYSSRHGTWFNASVHCTSATECFDQSNREMPLDCSSFRFTDGVWVLQRNCTGAKSYRDGGIGADMVLIPIADGVYVHVYQLPKSGEIYHGLVFAPNRSED